jgi:hypothetical protein
MNLTRIGGGARLQESRPFHWYYIAPGIGRLRDEFLMETLFAVSGPHGARCIAPRL